MRRPVEGGRRDFDPIQIAYKRRPKNRRYASTGSNFALTEKQTADLKRRLREALVEELAKSQNY